MNRILAAAAAAVLLAGCSSAPDQNSLDYDPNERFNQTAHKVNVAVDRAAFGPVARAYGNTVPAVVRRGFTNISDNWKLPGHVVQAALQGKGVEVAKSTTRFMVNTVFGLGGIIDIAKDMDLPYEENGFNETLYQWGVPEGGYLEIPLGGPGTERDWASWVVDMAADPVNWVLPQNALNGLLVAGGLDVVNTRYEIDSVVEAMLHQSANSYDATRIAYLQNMRAELARGSNPTSGDAASAVMEDVYMEDVYLEDVYAIE